MFLLWAIDYQRLNKLEEMAAHVPLTGPTTAYKLCDLLSSYQFSLAVSQTKFLTVNSSPIHPSSLSVSTLFAIIVPQAHHPVHVKPSHF